MSGHPVQIVVFKDDHTFQLNEESLAEILLQDHVKDKNVVVVSVAGAFRKGKSFLLDFFLRYMNHPNKDEWMNNEELPLTGFSWRGGSERDTTGILMWSQAFIVPLRNGEQVAVLLMDTQGAFDSESTVKDCATVFALSTMTSSVQVYNISNNVQENDLQHLQLFTEYGKLALEDTREKPFQKLQFLVRDWNFPYEHGFGTDGGQVLLDKRFQVSENQHPELQNLRKHIKSCFSHIGCFLMPYPGNKVARNPKCDGRLSDIEEDFKEQLKVLVPSLLSQKNLIVKEINGHRIKARELMEYFKAYVKVYQGDELPEPKTMLEATAEANNLAAVSTSKEFYSHSMELLCGGDKPYMNAQLLEIEHLKLRDQSIDSFNSSRKMGGTEFSQMYLVRLQKEIDDSYENFCKNNENKNVFAAARTPATLFTVAIMMYMLSTFFGIFGLSPLASMCNWIVGLSLLSLAMWMYVRYSGECLEVGEKLDEIANSIWDIMLKPIYKTMFPKQDPVTMVNTAMTNKRKISKLNNTKQE
ncbi:Atlastin-2 [Nymphon striatum]|nr:Atlastin-2 [Nymphon striatum]